MLAHLVEALRARDDFPSGTRVQFIPVAPDDGYVSASLTRDRLNQIGLRASLNVEMGRPIATGERLTSPDGGEVPGTPVDPGRSTDADLTSLDHPSAPKAGPVLRQWLATELPGSREFFLTHRDALRASAETLSALAALATSNTWLARHNALITLDRHEMLDAGYEYLMPTTTPAERKDIMTGMIGTGNAEVLEAFTQLASGVATIGSERSVVEVLDFVGAILRGQLGPHTLSPERNVYLSGNRRVRLVEQLLDLSTAQPQHVAALTRLAESIVTCPPPELTKLLQNNPASA